MPGPAAFARAGAIVVDDFEALLETTRFFAKMQRPDIRRPPAPGVAVIAGDRIGMVGVALGFGLSLMVMAAVIGPVSGCHINPAVTLAMLVARRVGIAHAALAWIGQLVGAVLGGAVVTEIVFGWDGLGRWFLDGVNNLDVNVTLAYLLLTAVIVILIIAAPAADCPRPVNG